MKLLMQLIRGLWIGLTIPGLLCEGKFFASEEIGVNLKATSGILTGKTLLPEKFYKTPKIAPFQMKDEADYEDSISEESSGDEDDTLTGDSASDEDDDEENDDTTESYESEDGKGDVSVDFDDADFALEAISEGVLKSIKSPNGESYVPCFGMWWPVSGGAGYDYYIYGDYGGGGDYATDDGGDYTDGRRRKRKRARRMRNRKKAAKRKRRRRRRNKTA